MEISSKKNQRIAKDVIRFGLNVMVKFKFGFKFFL
jgi:hypothetical protein